MATQTVADNVVEYKLRVPRNLVKNYYVMKINAPRPIKFDDVSEAHLSRQKKSKADEEELAGPSFGAGSEYGKDRKEESKKRRRTMTVPKKTKKEDLPFAMRLGDKKGKWYAGRKEGTILENASYYVLTQSPDGVFEAVPVQAWYNFIPNIHYHTLTADEVEEEFSKRDKTINFMNLMVKKRLEAIDDNEEEANTKVKSKSGDRLLIHDDDFIDVEMSDDDDVSDSEGKPAKKGGKKKKSKDFYQGKMKRKADDDDIDDSDEEEEFDRVESKEVDYMSEASSDDEEQELQDEPDPVKLSKKGKAKDDINAYTLSESEEEREADEELTNVGKELKEMLKRETGEDETSGEEDEEDEDIDSSEKYTKSALFMQGGKEGKKKKGRSSGSNSGSASSSRSCTPTPLTDGMQSNSPAGAKKINKEDKMGNAKKRPNSRIGQTDSSTPPPKKQKQSPPPPVPASSSGGNGNNTNELTSITEEAIRRYLSHKPMTTTDLVKKFKHKKTGLTKEELVSTIAAILKRIGPEREIIDGKLYLSIKLAKR